MKCTVLSFPTVSALIGFPGMFCSPNDLTNVAQFIILPVSIFLYVFGVSPSADGHALHFTDIEPGYSLFWLMGLFTDLIQTQVIIMFVRLHSALPRELIPVGYRRMWDMWNGAASHWGGKQMLAVPSL